jgi:restriction endonuclease S subunit
LRSSLKTQPESYKRYSVARPYLICPPEWERTTLEPDADAGFILRAESGSTPSTTNSDYWDGDVPWLTPKEITDLGDRLFVSRTERCITKEGLRSSGAKLMQAGTVMLTKRAPVGAVVVNAIPMATNQGFMNFTCGPKLRPAFLAVWLVVNNPYLHLVANGSTYPELYSADLFEFEISVPAVAYQDRVLAVTSAFQAVLAMEASLEQLVMTPDGMAQVQDSAAALRRLQQTLLPQLVSGGVDLDQIDIPEGLMRGFDGRR